MPPTTPLTSQVTDWSCAPVTVAWKICDPVRGTAADEGKTDTLTPVTMVTEIEAAFDGSARGVTVICTVGGEGGIEGAVYTPIEETAPQAAPVQPVPATLQVIARLGFELAAGVSVAV